jgi:monoamine oxidase
MGQMDKLWLEFPTAFWTEDLDNDWINFVSDKPGEWVQTLNLYKYLEIPVLLMFNIGDTARRFSTLSDQEVVNSAMETIRKWYSEVPDYVNFKRSNWGQDPYSGGAWAFIKAGSAPEDCDAYFESESTGRKVFFAGEATTSQMIGTVHGAYITGTWAAKDAADSLNEALEE